MFSNGDLVLGTIKLLKSWVWQNGTQRLCFLFITRGGGRYAASNNANWELSTGDVLVVSSSMRGEFSSPNRNGIMASYFVAAVEHLFSIFSLSEYCFLRHFAQAMPAPWHFSAQTELARKCHTLVASTPRNSTSEHRCHLLKILAAVVDEVYPTAPASVRNGSGDHVEKVLNQLSITQIQELSVEEMAKVFGCSRRHLTRLFHERFQMSVSEFKMEVRLLKACAALQDPGSKVITVAMDCGFNHLGLFSSRFRKRFGLNPSQWRKQALVGEHQRSARRVTEECPMRERGLCPWPTSESGAAATQLGAPKFGCKEPGNQSRFTA